MMKSLRHFPEVITAKLCELRRVEPNLNNARILMDVIDSSRQSLGDWYEMFINVTTRDGIYDLIKRRHDQWNKLRGFCFGIYASNLLVGRIRVFDLDLPMQSAQLGFWLADEFVGRGIMSDALDAVVSVLFEFGFERIELRIDCGNTRAENLAKRAGFVCEGRLRRKSCARGAGGACDLGIYSKLKSDVYKEDTDVQATA